MDPELELLGSDPFIGGLDHSIHEGRKNAPVFTGDALEAIGGGIFPQRALYARILAQECNRLSPTFNSPKLYINTNAPFSGLVCGVQGSGKSHSTSVLLESCLVCDRRLGTLPSPLSALLFHFDTAAGGCQPQPCEAAYLASLDVTRGGDAKPPKVTVLVMPNSLRSMKKVYSALPRVTVEPLHFTQEDISGDRLLSMMKVDQEHMPLYMECIMNILRKMDTFDYQEFRQQLSEEKFSPSQKAMLELRLNLLNSCIGGGNASNGVSRHFRQGQLTIIDLSSPFMDGSSACGFFEIILGLFIQKRETETWGKIVVLDEAHKYLSNSGSSSRLTDSLLSVIRQQRHLATRVLISTQEPTVVPPSYLDLCSFVIVHRVSSPKWLEHLKQHLPALDAQSFSRAFTLKTGEAMIFASSGVGLRNNSGSQVVSSPDPTCTFGPGYLLVRSRERITTDGGRSILAAADGSTAVAGPSSTEIAHMTRHVSDSVYTDSSVSKTPSYTTSAYERSIMTTEQMNNVWPASILETSKTESIAETGSSVSFPSRAPVHEVPAENPATHIPPASSISMEVRFQPLVAALAGQGRLSWTVVGAILKQYSPPPYEGKLGSYLKLAAEAKLVEIGNDKPRGDWVQLTVSHSVPPQFAPLVETMRIMLASGDTRLSLSLVADKLKKRDPTAFTGRFKEHVIDAERAMVVKYDATRDRINLC